MWNPIDPDAAIFEIIQEYSIPKPLIFIIFVLISCLIGKYTPSLIQYIIRRAIPINGKEISENFVRPIQQPFRMVGIFTLISMSMIWLEENRALYRFIRPFVSLALIASIAWLASRLFRQLVRIYGIPIIRKYGMEVDETFLVFETIANVLIGFTAAIAFAQSQQLPLGALVAGASVSGLAVAFAAQSTLEQILGTIVLRLDRPFVRGEYIRLPKRGDDLEGIYGRVESIGLRSTKIRIAAKGTLAIIPNSNLMRLAIENISRGKKVMVLLYLDFITQLDDREQALVEQAIKECTDSVFGIDPGSTQISLFNYGETGNLRARVTFFILGSSENAISLRKSLLASTNQSLTERLKRYGIKYNMQEPNIYVESPVTI
ncbi:MAG: mechanosensitive ion channel [Limnospira sp. PMC 1291.21]|uniref:Small-conductance mechanosensitive ion channel, MscS-like n=3 Tax=Limnospira TaxID=2596745 RepID=A0A9P1KEE8_9CYAN|nr:MULTISPECIES: mechanosensitive ion channel domain-containing protein [Limnospira]EKD05857.1 MscS Mechanosensitive ion channel [Arthrospira platensis C1]MDC0836926.1 mechanosensitive ion channel [Limnoraphis robusta]MDY7051082.1 mechanosensitive ion channel [Limnospira fusiformis LS22]QJB27062.1 mechanosensitive ion channel [Limnospira fusiformis SAG 85.79]RAQ40535.1 mechanosensitive ion channel protein MscS [Arthrospira sp. O9.13F]